MPLPLDLTPFEMFLLGPGAQGGPMTFIIRLILSGPFDPAAFRVAVDRAVAEHPLLGANVAPCRRRGFRSWRWVPASSKGTYLDVAGAEVPLKFPAGEPFDLATETGLRIWVRHGDGSVDMRFQFHHACCDGTGAYRVIEDILCVYDRTVNGPSSRAELRALDRRLLARRDQLKVNPMRLLARLRRNLLILPRRTVRFFLEKLAPLRSSGTARLDEDAARRVPDMPSHTFDKSQTKRLREAALAGGGSTNELLLRDLLLSLRQWNADHGGDGRSRTLRVLVPVSLRRQEDDEMPAANVVSMVYIDRRAAAMDRPSELMADLAREIHYIRTWQIDHSWHRAARRLRYVLPMFSSLRWLAHRCYATAVLSNMGKLMARAQLPRRGGKLIAGQLTLEEIHGAPPTSPYTPASFSCHWYAGRLGLTLNYRRQHFTAEEAEALLGCWVDRLRKTAES